MTHHLRGADFSFAEEFLNQDNPVESAA